MSNHWLLSTCLLAVWTSTSSASVITSNTGGSSLGAFTFYGQSFTTPSGPSYNNISFNFFGFNFFVPPPPPTAAGMLYLFTSAYTGTPLGLSGAAAIAHSTSISSGMYFFDPSVTLLPSTQYFVYADTAFNVMGGNTVVGQTSYFTGSSSSSANFIVDFSGHSVDFQVSGSAVPEPASFALVVPVIAVLILFRRPLPDKCCWMRTAADATTPLTSRRAANLKSHIIG